MEQIPAWIPIAVGLVAGPLMLGCVGVAYLKNSVFGLGGVVMTVFGTLLIALSVWRNVDIDVNKDGGFKIKIEAIERKLSNLETKYNETIQQVQVLSDIPKATKLATGDVRVLQKKVDTLTQQMTQIKETIAGTPIGGTNAMFRLTPYIPQAAQDPTKPGLLMIGQGAPKSPPVGDPLQEPHEIGVGR